MISCTGKNLSVLIVTQTDLDWQTFATWYSFYTNLPDAKISIFCHRTDSVPFLYYQWTKRLGIPNIKMKPFSEDGPDFFNWLNAIRFSKPEQPLLVVRPFVMAIDILNNKLLDFLNKINFCNNEEVLFLNNKNIDNIFNEFFIENKLPPICNEKICVEAKETGELSSLVSYKKGCGRWIDTAKGCPFSSAGGLVTSEMTANETRIIELWKKMVPLYHAVN
jgi:hypothetical protein